MFELITLPYAPDALAPVISAETIAFHHVKHLRQRPDLALSIWDPDTGARQLVTVCKACHEREHPESLRRSVPAAPLTAERWD